MRPPGGRSASLVLLVVAVVCGCAADSSVDPVCVAPVITHVAVTTDSTNVLRAFVAAGLQGIEGLRPCVDSRDRNFFRRMARRHGLFLTGGSDWHGWTDAGPGLFRLQASELRDFLDALLAA
jgi:hypothetical protein